MVRLLAMKSRISHRLVLREDDEFRMDGTNYLKPMLDYQHFTYGISSNGDILQLLAVSRGLGWFPI